MTIVSKRTFCTALVFCGMITVTAGKTALSFEPKVGKPLAGFTLPRIGSGDPVSLSDYQGQKVLLIMFASW